VTGEPEPDAPFPPELASETIARLYERQGKPGKAAAVRALLRGASLEVRADGDVVRVSWLARAPGAYVLRVVRFGAMERGVEDLPAEGTGGSASWTGPPGWICVAIGRGAGGEFSSLAHAAPLRFDGRGG
jgi:hypothetical protein